MPWDSLKEVPDSVKIIDGVALTLDQANALARQAVGLEKDAKVDNSWAIAKTQFKKTHEVKAGAWVSKSLDVLIKEYHHQKSLQIIASAITRLVLRRRALAVWKSEGKRWYLAIVSKATRDREGELVTELGMDCSIVLSAKHRLHSGLYLQHQVPYTRVGTSVQETRIGPYWLEIGQFDDSWLANTIYDRIEKDREGKYKLSIGFVAPKGQARAGVYTKLLKYDTSVVLRPACPGTALMITGGNEMIDDVLKLLEPKSPEERESFTSALRELLSAANAPAKMLDRVEKAGQSPSIDEQFKALIGKCSGETAKELKGLQASVAKLFPPEEEEEEEEEKEEKEKTKKPTKPKAEEKTEGKEDEEGEVEKKTKAEESFNVEGAIGALAAEIQKLNQRIDDVTESQVIAKALAEAIDRWPKERAARPQSEEVDPDAMDTLVKALGDVGNRPTHPLADFAGAPTSSEGGV